MHEISSNKLPIIMKTEAADHSTLSIYRLRGFLSQKKEYLVIDENENFVFHRKKTIQREGYPIYRFSDIAMAKMMIFEHIRNPESNVFFCFTPWNLIFDDKSWEFVSDAEGIRYQLSGKIHNWTVQIFRNKGRWITHLNNNWYFNTYPYSGETVFDAQKLALERVQQNHRKWDSR